MILLEFEECVPFLVLKDFVSNTLQASSIGSPYVLGKRIQR